MRLALLGMSGIGKTYWSDRLAGAGFTCRHCDDMIAARLTAQLGTELATLDDMGRWMGFPDQPGFQEREDRHVAAEEEVMREVIDELSRSVGAGDDVVIDLTGSAIYADARIWTALRSLVTVVHLSTREQVLERMALEYISNPHPLIWRGIFRRETGEPFASAVVRSYANLVHFRKGRYEALSHATIAYDVHRRAGLTVEEFLRLVTESVQSVQQV